MEENIKDMLIPVMNRTNKVVQLVLEQRMQASKVDLTIKQFILLHKVNEQERAQSELAMITNRNKGSLTRLIQSLERKKFVTRRIWETDCRMNLVKITAKGRKALSTGSKVVRANFEALTNQLTEEEVSTVIKANKKLMARAAELLDTEHN